MSVTTYAMESDGARSESALVSGNIERFFVSDPPTPGQVTGPEPAISEERSEERSDERKNMSIGVGGMLLSLRFAPALSPPHLCVPFPPFPSAIPQ